MDEQANVAAAEVAPPARQNPILKFFSNPWVSMTATISSLISIPLSIYLAFAALAKPKLTYYIHPVRTPIVVAGQSSDLHVTYNATEIRGPVSAVQLAFWNEGKQPVRPDDVLTPIEIVMDPPCEILESSIRKQTRPEVGLHLNGTTNKAMIGIAWRVLEEGDGVLYRSSTRAIHPSRYPFAAWL